MKIINLKIVLFLCLVSILLSSKITNKLKTHTESTIKTKNTIISGLDDSDFDQFSSDDYKSDLVEDKEENQETQEAKDFSVSHNNNALNLIEKKESKRLEPVNVPVAIEIEKAKVTALKNKVAQKLINKNFNVAISEKIEHSFRNFKGDKNCPDTDDFVCFLKYLKECSEKTILTKRKQTALRKNGWKFEKKPEK